MDVQRLAEEFAHRIAYLPSIEAVYVTRAEDGVEYWVVGSHVTEDEEYAVYDAKWSLLSERPKVGMDLHLVDRGESPLEELLDVNHFAGAASLVDRRERQNA